MFSLPFLPDPATLYLQPLNALLRREDWARERLARHAGKSVRFLAGPVKVNLSVQAQGLVGPCDPAVVPDVILTVPASQFVNLPGVLRSRDPATIADLMHIEGDAGLAHVVSDLARDLRWDPEEDLARVVGDVVASRVASGVRGAAAGLRGAAERLAGNTVEYLTEESGLMAARPAFEDWSGGVAQLATRLDALEARISSHEYRAGRPASRSV
ncbi:hypothetical protein GSY71_07320 [Pusillimonas sp. TS35]|uniref:ubiquinone biosynthesis accessory factor UbiJ n=1 Tax=Paracandidimonas lactea TaxID=2895524 RepID=UPI0013691BAF|nr:SCP2 sterol-binding domain-containing protein [Paracandidimonas lactea]MYN12954.1 hypothetical protein [Pusillimonas sp. TS35]